MKKTILFCLLICVLVSFPLLASCGPEATPTPTAKPTPTAGTPTPTAAAHWWDKLGEPEYGGTITLRINNHMPVWEPGTPAPGAQLYMYENLVTFDWALDRDIWPFVHNFAPLKYHMGVLAESWEQPDPQTLVFHIRKGITWQDIPPVNGRAFNAYDVKFHYDRWLGKGEFEGQPPNPLHTWLSMIDSVNVPDDYTVEFKFTKPSVLAVFQIFDQAIENQIEPRELMDLERVEWNNAVGTGAWMVTDFVAGTSITFGRNPNYWGHDERHPENQLPYADELKVLVIEDIATTLAAMRTGKIDFVTDVPWQQVDSILQSNPEILKATRPADGPALDMRVDMAPFTDINVRKALQMSIDRQAMAQSLFGGKVDGTPCSLLSPAHGEYHYAYEDWPQSLKDEYSYNPERARELLAQAGYPDGFNTNVVAASNANLEVLQAMKSYFADIGVNMDIELMDFTSERVYVMQGKHDQMAYSTMHATGTTRPPHNMLNSRLSTDVELNIAKVNDPAYDALLEKFNSATTEEEMAKASRECDKYIAEHHWAIYTFPGVGYILYQPWLKGFMGDGSSGGGGTGWAEIYARWWVDQELKASME